MRDAGARFAAPIDRVEWGLFFVLVDVSFLAHLGWSGFVPETDVQVVPEQSARWHCELKFDRFALLLGA